MKLISNESIDIAEMLSKKTESERFSKVLLKLNSTSQKTQPTKLPSNQNSFLQDLSIRSQKSTKYGSQIEARSLLMDQSKAVRVLLQEPQVLINKLVTKMKTEFVPTSNGMKYVILLGDIMINLSWLHSVQQLQPGKLLLLYYDLKGLGEGKPKMQSLILQAGRTQSSTLLAALAHLHMKYHDDEIQKLYHYLC